MNSVPAWKKKALREIPATEEILQLPAITELLKTIPRPLVTESIRMVLDAARQRIMALSKPAALEDSTISKESLIAGIRESVNNKISTKFRRVINAAGIVLHTALGRAVLAPQVLEAFKQELAGYTRLAADFKTGKRLDRDKIIEDLLCEITGAEAATIVNNNAAATMLILNTLAKGKDVICSRGQMVEIGGSFRIPDIMAASGARLVSVGTTNRTHLKDYRKAIKRETGAILRVHSSNYRIVGFTAEVSIKELVALAHQHRLPVIDDVGSGALVDLSAYGLEGEPLVSESIKAGSDVICFSGDKLIGGPQAGIILGKKKYIDPIRKNPLARALRIGKLSLIALEATLRLFRDKDTLFQNNPTLKMLTAELNIVGSRAQALETLLHNALPDIDIKIVDEESQPGSGALAGYTLPTKCLAVRAKSISAQALAEKLRLRDVPIFTRIKGDRVLFDLRTIFEGEESEIIKALKEIIR